MKPRISIITCVRNQERYLPELLHSFSIQENNNFEVIFIDGNSSDISMLLINQFIKKYSRKIQVKVFSFPPKGISDAMNKGIEKANGEYVIIVHADDHLLDKHSVTRMVEILKKYNNDWIIGNYVRKFGKIVITSPTYLFRYLHMAILKYYNGIPHQNMLIRKDVFAKIGYYLSTLPVSMDHEFYLRMLANKIYPRFVNTAFTVFRKRWGATSISPKAYIDLLNNPDNIFKRYRETLKNEKIKLLE